MYRFYSWNESYIKIRFGNSNIEQNNFFSDWSTTNNRPDDLFAKGKQQTTNMEFNSLPSTKLPFLSDQTKYSDHPPNSIDHPSHLNDQSTNKLFEHIHDNNQHQQLKSLFNQFERTFDTGQYTTARTPVRRIIETLPHTPLVSKCYASNPALIKEMKSIMDKLTQSKLVRQSNSPYAAAALLTRKKDNTWRLVIDYKKLNLITIKDNYPLPNIEITLKTLGKGYRYFSKLDLRSGFGRYQ